MIGAAIGGAVSMASALLTPRITARLSRQQFDREVEVKKLDGLADVLDAAGLALEEVHWALRDAVDALAVPEAGGSADGPDAAWHEVGARLTAGAAEASRQGMRLGLRLGAPASGVKSGVVGEYDALQRRYRELVRRVRIDSPARRAEVDLAAIEHELDLLGEDQHAFINAAADRLRPLSVTTNGGRSHMFNASTPPTRQP